MTRFVIDAHAHTVGGVGGGVGAAGESLMAKWTVLESAGIHLGKPTLPEEELLAGAAKQIAMMDEVGTDVQLTSPRPFILKHSHKPATIVHWWCQLNNDAIALQNQAYSTRIQPVIALPQVAGDPITDTFEELDRGVTELGAVGIMLNPDPSEGAGTSPTLADEYWFPLFQKLSDLNLPALIHGAGCYGRESYSEHFISEESLAIMSLIRGKVLQTFPDLKIIVGHGGGSVPYQLGRWIAHDIRWPKSEYKFIDALRQLYFDSCLYTSKALDLLIDAVGSSQVLFGTERPGSGGPIDDLLPVIEALPGLSEGDREAIFSGNALKIFSRLSEESLRPSLG